MSKDAFDNANIFQMEENIGIARMYAKAESYSLENSTKKYALFFEDDYILGEDYINASNVLMEWVLTRKKLL